MANTVEEVATAPPLGVVSAGTNPVLSAVLPPPNVLPVEPVVETSPLSGGTVDRRVYPVYPPQAVKFRLQGRVVVKAVVRKDGSVRDVKAIDGNLLLARAATDAVAKWHFQPFRLNGQPIEMATEITLLFKLP